MVAARLFEPGDVVPGTKYRVVRQLGAGGMGVVYQVVKPPQIGGVLKLMAADLAVHEEFRTRFFDEVRVLAQLDHPNIVRVFDYDALSDGTPYYVMEMLHGRTVRDVLGAVGRVPPRVAFEVTRQLLEALHCAHTNEIPVVHRDIKPENIFLHAPRHGEPVVKLIDFGVVAVADRQHDGTFVGTWKYAAPEQIRGEQATPATDLYAVGLVLYEMLAGAGPFDRYETGPAVATAHVREVPAPVNTLAPWVPSSVVALIASALAKDPSQRPKDAYAFAERLFELEWASDGKDPHDVTREGPTAPGPLSRVLTDVGGPDFAVERASDGKIGTSAIPESKKHRGTTLPGVGDAAARHEPTTPDDDALLEGLIAREKVAAGGEAPISRKARESSPHGERVDVSPRVPAVAPGTPPPGQMVIRSPHPPGVSPHDAVTVEGPRSDPRLGVAGVDAGKNVDTDTFASTETDARRKRGAAAGRGRIVIGAAALAGLALVAAFLLLRRTATPEISAQAPDVRSQVVGAQPVEPNAVENATASTATNVGEATNVDANDAGSNVITNANGNANGKTNVAGKTRAQGVKGATTAGAATTTAGAATTTAAPVKSAAPASSAPRPDLMRHL